MNFQTIRDAIISTLGTGAGSDFRVIGYQKRAQDESTIIDTDRSVQVFYSAGRFPEESSSCAGALDHHMTFAFRMMVAQPAKVDLTTLNNPASTAAQRAVALAAKQEAEYLADQSIDDLWDKVVQIIMSGINIDFGLAFNVSSRLINDFEKMAPLDDGQYIILSANATLTCRIDEQVPGETPLSATDGVDFALNVQEETIGTEGAGIEQDIS